jgi:hypothetical protein
MLVPRPEEAAEFIGGPGVERLPLGLGLLQGGRVGAGGGGDRQETAVDGIAERRREGVVDVSDRRAGERAAAGRPTARLLPAAAVGVTAVALEVGVEGGAAGLAPTWLDRCTQA